jgi:hypothetical protein
MGRLERCEAENFVAAPAGASSTEKLAWMQQKLRTKHPSYSEQAIIRIAKTILAAENAAREPESDTEILDERRTEEEQVDDKKFQQQQEHIQRSIHAEDKTAYQTQHQLRLKQLCENPLYKNLFAGAKPANTIDQTQFTGVNRRDELGRTPLHWAADEGDLAKCKELIEKKVKVWIKDNSGNTAYMIAVREGHDAVAKYILSTQTLVTDPV